MPAILSSAYAAAAPLMRRTLAAVGAGPSGEVPAILVQAGHRIESIAAERAAALLGQGLALVNLLALLAVTPLVSFYLLRDWPKVVSHVDRWLPRDHAETIRELGREADRVLSGFARGAALVCAMLALFYGVALSIAGLDFGLLIGFAAGALSFVPYLGTLIGFGAAVGMALIQFWPDWVRVVIVGAVFVFGNAVSDYVVTPRIVGDRFGLHPLWVLFGFFAGAALFGFVGMLISVPACALVGVIARFALRQYEASALYRGTTPEP
jgi:predicted PurR-regulated permease PerM